MIQIRHSLFETNSSSANMLVIPKDTNLIVPKKIRLLYGISSIDWSTNNVLSPNAVNFVYSLCVDTNISEVYKLISYLKRKGVDIIEGIDEIGDIPTEEIPLIYYFKNEYNLDHFCFGIGSFVKTVQTDSENYSDDIYDTSKYVTIAIYD